MEEWIPFLQELIVKYHLDKVKKIVPGGETGQQSIYHGLCAARKIAEGDKTIVLIHDGVRPLIHSQLISDCIRKVEEKGSAITTAPAIETIFRSSDKRTVDQIIERSDCMLARAPQCFYLDEILKRHQQAKEEGREFIDSASMMSFYGSDLYLVEGPMENIKITTPMDYYTFKALIEADENSQLFGV